MKLRSLYILTSPITSALFRAKVPIVIIAATYLISVTIGIVMVHSGNQFALSYRDNLIAKVQTGSVLTQENRLGQALTDFGGNSLGAVTDTILGLGIVLPFPGVLYRGWVGGIVSVNSNHQSRLTDFKKAAYYFSVVFLQLMGYSLAAGVGVHAGLSMFRARPSNAGFKWFLVPKEVLRDILLIYIVTLPIFLTASLWEFLSPWN